MCAMEISYGGQPGGQNGTDNFGRPAFVFNVHQVLGCSMTPLYDEGNTDVQLFHVRLQVSFIVSDSDGYEIVNNPGVAGAGANAGLGIPTAQFNRVQLLSQHSFQAALDTGKG
jgi:hypothetical protein